jgi:hypothetical protein
MTMDESYNDVQFVAVPLDGRNARSSNNDHRTQQGGSTALVPIGQRRVLRPVGQTMPSRPVVIYQQAPSSGPAGSGLFANLTVGEVVELAGAVLGAISPLPGAPVATGDFRTDMDNVITYQGALAVHAKQDERIRTIASLIGKLITK